MFSQGFDSIRVQTKTQLCLTCLFLVPISLLNECIFLGAPPRAGHRLAVPGSIAHVPYCPATQDQPKAKAATAAATLTGGAKARELPLPWLDGQPRLGVHARERRRYCEVRAAARLCRGGAPQPGAPAAPLEVELGWRGTRPSSPHPAHPLRSGSFAKSLWERTVTAAKQLQKCGLTTE